MPCAFFLRETTDPTAPQVERIGLEISEVDRASLTNVDALLDQILEHLVVAR